MAEFATLKQGDLSLVRGAHIVVDREKFPMKSALIVPKTPDGRVLFVIPWRNRIIIGTTDTALSSINEPPKPFSEEIGFILDNAQQYFSTTINRSDTKSVYAGVRPLVNLNPKNGSTSQVSREHHIEISDSGFITIAGGKWTTYRKMGEEVIDKAEESSGMVSQGCQTETLAIHTNIYALSFWRRYTRSSTQSTVLDNKAALSLANQVADDLVSADCLTEAYKAQAIEELLANNGLDLESLPHIESSS